VAPDAPSERFAPGQIVTVFRSRLRPEHAEAYAEDADDIAALALTMPGLIDVKDFAAEDGERISVITFADRDAHDAWRRHADHAAAQQRGRGDYYAWYSLQVCETVRVSRFGAPADPKNI
jgi:heme-degrading monooxygenase HmoA